MDGVKYCVSTVNGAETYTSGQDRLTGMGFTLLLETIKKTREKYIELQFARHGLWTVKDKHPWEMGNNWVEPYRCPVFCLHTVSRWQHREEEPRWAQQTQLVRICKAKSQRGESCTENYQTEHWSAYLCEKTIGGCMKEPQRDQTYPVLAQGWDSASSHQPDWKTRNPWSAGRIIRRVWSQQWVIISHKMTMTLVLPQTF